MEQKTITHKFEVPYTFDKGMIPFFEEHSEYISYVFVASYKDDCFSTNRGAKNDKDFCIMPETREEYESHLQALNNSKIKYCVLWQDANNTISREMLDYYVGDLGVDGFMVSSDECAAAIKKYNNDLLVISSITRCLCKGITKMDFTNYDYIVLYYPFNRALDCLKKLEHIKHKLVLLVNSGCYVNCNAYQHWFCRGKYDTQKLCQKMNHIPESIWISPEHLYLFDNYVAGYKLLGRESGSDIVRSDCLDYFNRHWDWDNFKSDFFKITHQTMNSMSLEEYYNIKTKDIVDII